MTFHFCCGKDFLQLAHTNFEVWIDAPSFLRRWQVTTTSPSSLKSTDLCESVCQAGSDPGPTELNSREAESCSEFTSDSLPCGLNTELGALTSPTTVLCAVTQS